LLPPPDLRSGRSKCKCGGNATAVGNPASGYDWHSNSVNNLRHQRQCPWLRGAGTVKVRPKEHTPITAGFIALSDNDVDATSFQPERLSNSRR
jgi:hypothetical protein